MYADLPGAAGPNDLGLGVLSVPQINLDGDRAAEPRRPQGPPRLLGDPQRTEDQTTRVEWNRDAGGFSFNENYMLPVYYTSVWAQQTAKVTTGRLPLRHPLAQGPPAAQPPRPRLSPSPKPLLKP